MTVLNLPLLSYDIQEDIVSLKIFANSIEEVKALATTPLMIKDGVGNDFYELHNFTVIQGILISGQEGGIYTITLSKSDTSYDKIEEQLKDAKERSKILEDCIIELAQIIYQ